MLEHGDSKSNDVCFLKHWSASLTCDRLKARGEFARALSFSFFKSFFLEFFFFFSEMSHPSKLRQHQQAASIMRAYGQIDWQGPPHTLSFLAFSGTF